MDTDKGITKSSVVGATIRKCRALGKHAAGAPGLNLDSGRVKEELSVSEKLAVYKEK